MGSSDNQSTKVDPLLWFDASFQVEKVISSVGKDNGQNYQIQDLVPQENLNSNEDITLPFTNAIIDSNGNKLASDSLKIDLEEYYSFFRMFFDTFLAYFYVHFLDHIV